MQRQRCIRVLAAIIEAYVFNLILLANQGDSPWQPKRSLRVATAFCYNYYVQLVATRRNWMRVANLNLAKGGEAGRAIGCRVSQGGPITASTSLLLYSLLHDQLHPPFSKRCEILNLVRASNLA